MKKSLFAIAILLLAAPAMAAWVGDVPDVAPAGQFVLQSTGVVYATMSAAYTAAALNDTILIGPGTYPTAGNTISSDTKRVSLIGSGSGNNPLSDTIFDPANVGGGRLVRIDGPGALTPDLSIVVAIKDIRYVNNPSTAYGIEGVGNLLFENLYCEVADNPADPNGWGDGITFGAADGATVRNCRFDGNDGYGIRVAGSYVGRNWLIEGNEFENLKNGMVINSRDTQNVRILNNSFKNMTERNSEDMWNPYGNAGLIIAPRCTWTGGHWSLGGIATPGLIKNILVEGNLFQDNAFTTPEPGESPTHGWVNPVDLDILSDAGMALVTFTYGTIENVLVRGNTFKETAAGGVQQYGVRVTESDYIERDLAVPAINRYNTTVTPWALITPGNMFAIPTGVQGKVKYLALDGNTFVGMTADVKGVVFGSVMAVPRVYPVDMAGVNAVGVIEVGDSVGADRKITIADINGNTADIDWDGDVDAADKVALVTMVLSTSVADTDLSMKVDIVDLGNLANLYDLAGQFQDGDTDFNGLIDIVDLGNMANDYDKNYSLMPAVPGYIGGANVPEPATLSLLGLLGLGLLRRRSA